MKVVTFVVLTMLLTVGVLAQQLADAKPGEGTAIHPSSGTNTLDVEILSDTKRMDLTRYLVSVRSQVRGKWSIPPEARAPEFKSGNSTIEFILTKSGAMAESKIASSAGDESLDRAALDAVKSAPPFPQLPSEFEGESIIMRATFTYNQAALRSTFPQMSSLPGSIIEQAARPAASGESVSADGTAGSNRPATSSRRIPDNVEVLSDTKGVDFGPYLNKTLQAIRMNWYNLIPEAARPPRLERGNVSIEFAILPDGKVTAMKIVKQSGDVALDRAAWGGITASIPFAPLPNQFTGPYLALRFNFFYNPDKGDLQSDQKKPTSPYQ